MNRIEINVATGEQAVVPLTAEEIADAEARATAEANDPERLQAIADEGNRATAKSDNVIQYLVTHTPAECAAYVNANVNNLADAKAFLGKVAMALSVLARREFR